MSGGSFDYAYRCLILGEVEDVAAGRWKLNEIATAMAHAGYPEAAAPVAAIVARIDALEAWTQGLGSDGLPELLKAYEWWTSGDTSEDSFRAELDKYLTGTSKATP